MTTQKQLKSVLHYNPETGDFFWIKTLSHRAVAGRKAGSLVNGYYEISIYGKRNRSHRLAFVYMTGKMPKKMVDHINGIKTDNRWVNLRECDNSKNLGNMKRPKHNKSGVKGVYWDSSRKKWHAQIQRKGKSISLGRYKTIDDAAKAYWKAAKEYFGDFARAA